MVRHGGTPPRLPRALQPLLQETPTGTGLHTWVPVDGYDSHGPWDTAMRTWRNGFETWRPLGTLRLLGELLQAAAALGVAPACPTLRSLDPPWRCPPGGCPDLADDLERVRGSMSAAAVRGYGLALSGRDGLLFGTWGRSGGVDGGEQVVAAQGRSRWMLGVEGLRLVDRDDEWRVESVVLTPTTATVWGPQTRAQPVSADARDCLLRLTGRAGVVDVVTVPLTAVFAVPLTGLREAAEQARSLEQDLHVWVPEDRPPAEAVRH